MDNDPLSLTLTKAAKIAALEPHYFSRVFRENVGESFVKWRRRERILRAIKALQAGGPPIMEVAVLVGYRERRSLERAIKAMTGSSPSAFKCKTQDVTLRHPEKNHN